MRRGRILTGFALLVAAISLSGAPSALAATPQEICTALQNAAAAGQDTGAVLATFSPADVQAFLNDPTIQGYGCGPIITPPPAQTCAEGNGSNGSGSNGSGSNDTCAHPCTEATPGGSNGTGSPGSPGTPGSNTEQCQTTPASTPPSTPASTPNASVPLTPVVTPSAPAVIAGVAGTRKTIVVNAKPKPSAKAKQTPHVLGAQSPTKSAVAPVAVARKRGTLPFTGAELGLFALVGLALVGSGLLLRTTARQREREQS